MKTSIFNNAVDAHRQASKDLSGKSRLNSHISTESNAPEEETISLCMLVKNGGKTLKRTLAETVGCVDEILIVDNGSQDETTSVAQAYGARVIPLAGPLQDFSNARNRALDAATKRWIVILDADEILLREDFRRIRQRLRRSQSVGYRLFRYNYLQNGGWYFSPPACRIFLNKPQVRYENCVDETVEPSLRRYGSIKDSDICLHHTGYTDLSNRLNKVRFYLRLTEKVFGQGSKDSAALWHLVFRAFLLNEMGNYRDADHSLEEFFNLTAEANRSARQTLRGYMLQTRGLEKEAEAAYLSTLSAEDGSFKLSSYNKLGIIYFRRRQTEKAAEFFQAAIGNDGGAHPYINLGICCLDQRQAGRAEELFSEAIRTNPFLSKVARWNRTTLKNRYFDFMQDTVPGIEKFYKFILRQGFIKRRSQKPLAMDSVLAPGIGSLERAW